MRKRLLMEEQLNVLEIKDKICSRSMHLVPASSEFFYRDSHRPDGWDLWCKTCRKQWALTRPDRHFSDAHTGPIVLTLPVTRRFPITYCFNSYIHIIVINLDINQRHHNTKGYSNASPKNHQMY